MTRLLPCLMWTIFSHLMIYVSGHSTETGTKHMSIEAQMCYNLWQCSLCKWSLSGIQIVWLCHTCSLAASCMAQNPLHHCWPAWPKVSCKLIGLYTNMFWHTFQIIFYALMSSDADIPDLSSQVPSINEIHLQMLETFGKWPCLWQAHICEACYNMVWTPTLCIPDTLDRHCYFLFNYLI